MKDANIKEKLQENFLSYLAIPSQSDEKNPNVPSSVGQLLLAQKLEKDLKDLGLVDIKINEFGVLQAKLSANRYEPIPKIGWVCHLDTVDVGLSDHIKPQIIKNYDGKDIILNEKENIEFSIKENPEILSYIGDDIIVTDGTSVLGADNKAAIANVMTALWYLNENPSIGHGDIYLAFVPDEEIGLRGARKIDFDSFDVDYAYTIDCCGLGELVYETFNAASGSLSIKGVTAHPMSAKNVLVNPIMVANDFINMLDRAKMPENTANREGYIWITDINSDVLNCKIAFNIRNHNKDKFEASKEYLYKSCDLLKARYPKAKISIEISDVYANILDSINDTNRPAIDRLKDIYAKLAISPKVIPMRGGTDGSYLATRGIMTPNYFTGAHNFHSNKEFLPMDSFYKSLLVTINLMKVD